MAHEFKLSEIGLKLIKAYEGFRPIETTLVSGQSVIGYGHKYSPDEEAVISREKAEDLLKQDLEPYEAMINESIFAPLTQSQFDALVSLSYNIGPRAFLSSNVMHALNNGRPLEAASGFDEWRKSIIDGQTYVVDALVRRRTAEKALFLRPTEGVVAAPRHELPVKSDSSYPKNEPKAPTYGRYDLAGIVARAPYDNALAQELGDIEETAARRREDGPAGALTLSEIVPHDFDEDVDLASQDALEIEDLPLSDEEEGLSPIAVAAAEVSERLEALIGDRPDQDVIPEESNRDKVKLAVQKNQPDKASAPVVVEEPPKEETALDIVQPQAANDGTHEEYRRPRGTRPAQLNMPKVYIDNPETETQFETDDAAQSGSGAYWAALIFGASLLGGGAVRWLLTPGETLDAASAFLAPVATIVGGMIVLGALYYLIKSMARGKS